MLSFFLASLLPILFAFDGKTHDWRIVNDTVMGGRSSAAIEPGKKGLQWNGTVSLENNGGFCSIRSPEAQYDLSAYTGIRFRIKADGRKYALTAKTQRGFTPVSYIAYFQTTAGEWTEYEIPFSDMEGTIFAEPANVPVLDPAKITEIGLMIYDKQAGPFTVVLDELGVYQEG
jgi:monofunctional biosynthetic peptidoglycan transglycosylase